MIEDILNGKFNLKTRAYKLKTRKNIHQNKILLELHFL